MISWPHRSFGQSLKYWKANEFWIKTNLETRNTQHANNLLNAPHTTKNSRGSQKKVEKLNLSKLVWDLWEMFHVMK